MVRRRKRQSFWEGDFDKLLGAAQAGDQSALGELWSTYQGRLRGYLASFDPATAEDIASETWLGVARGLGHFSGGEAEFRSWLFTIAHRRMLDQRRSTSRRPVTAMEQLPERPSPSDPADEVLNREGLSRAQSLVASLPPDQARAVLLRVMGDLSVAEVAEILGKKPTAVRVLTHRGLHRLAQSLAGGETVAAAGWSATA